MSQSNDLDALLAELESDDAKCRDLAAAQLGDLVEADWLKAKDFRKTVKRLIAVVRTETNWEAKESMFNTLSSASSNEKASAIDWDPIPQMLDNLDVACLEHALIILGDSGDPKYKPQIRRYLDHPDETIATTAADALKTIDWRQQQRASQVQLKAGRNR